MLAKLDVNEDNIATDEDVAETKRFLETYVKTTNSKTQKIFVLDDHLDWNDLDEDEKRKCKVWDRCHARLGNSHDLAHGTKVCKLIAATSTTNTEIHFHKISNADNKINFSHVVLAFAHIIDYTKEEDTVWVNCSFSIVPGDDS